MIDADDGYDALKAHFQANSLSDLYGYCRGDIGMNQRWSGSFNYSSSSAYPQSIFIDRDGYIRAYALGAIDGNPTPWETLLDELTGAI